MQRQPALLMAPAAEAGLAAAMQASPSTISYPVGRRLAQTEAGTGATSEPLLGAPTEEATTAVNGRRLRQVRAAGCEARHSRLGQPKLFF